MSGENTINVGTLRARAAQNNNWQELIPVVEQFSERVETLEAQRVELEHTASVLEARVTAVEQANHDLTSGRDLAQSDVVRRLEALEAAAKATGGGQ